MSQGPRSRAQGPRQAHADVANDPLVQAPLQKFFAEQGEEFARRLTRLEEQLGQLRKRPAFSKEDNLFLVWVLGFTAGAHLDKPGEGERIFAWCRELQSKLFETGGNGS